MMVMRKRHDTQPPISTSTEHAKRLDKRIIARLTAGTLAVAAVFGVTAGHENTQDTQEWPVSDCSAEVTSAEKDASGNLQVGVKLGVDCEGAQGHRDVTVKDSGLAKVEPGDEARVKVVEDSPESDVFVHFPQDGKERGGLVDVAGKVQ